MELFGVRLRRSKKGREEDYDCDRSSSSEDDSDSDPEEDAPKSRSRFSWSSSSRHSNRRRGATRRRRGKADQFRRVMLKTIQMLPKTSQGWGVLLLSVLVTIYLVDFYTLFRTPALSQLRNIPVPDDAISYSRVMDERASLSNAETRSAGTEQGATGSAPDPAQNAVQDLSRPAAAVVDAPAEQPLNSTVDSGPQRAEQASKPVEQAPQAAESSVTSQAASSDTNPFSRTDVGLWVPPDTGRLSLDAIKDYYTRLARKYLEPFRDGIPRDKFFEILRRRAYRLTPDGANKGTQSMLFQIKSKRVYLLDPYEVPKNVKPFHRARVNELIYLLSNLATADRLPDTEFLVSIHDCVQTASKEHTYRAARFIESNPGFTIVGCNFSDNIPFPMWEGDESRGGGYMSWNQQMKEYAQDDTPWSQKMPKAVFRGGLRPSTAFSNRAEADKNCASAGRAALVTKAEQRPDILDVSVSGSCAGRKYVLNRLSPKDHHKYKYVLYAEGNCFWADRINRQLFGPSAVIKQETPCGQFFEPLLQPNVHYIPTDFSFTGLEDKIDSVKNDDARVQNVIKQANEFAWNFLTAEGIAAYAEVLLTEYTKLLVNKDIQIDEGAVDVTHKRFSGTSGKPS
mmetsp:Transcript_7820/g.23627  ORF Transcript_7820/g.23627 Transcript_7820/m.23627 type:complete len:624 (+) Transcript_7820:112-1983(+)